MSASLKSWNSGFRIVVDAVDKDGKGTTERRIWSAPRSVIPSLIGSSSSPESNISSPHRSYKVASPMSSITSRVGSSSAGSYFGGYPSTGIGYGSSTAGRGGRRSQSPRRHVSGTFEEDDLDIGIDMADDLDLCGDLDVGVDDFSFGSSSGGESDNIAKMFGDSDDSRRGSGAGGSDIVGMAGLDDDDADEILSSSTDEVTSPRFGGSGGTSLVSRMSASLSKKPFRRWNTTDVCHWFDHLFEGGHWQFLSESLEASGVDGRMLLKKHCDARWWVSVSQFGLESLTISKAQVLAQRVGRWIEQNVPSHAAKKTASGQSALSSSQTAVTSSVPTSSSSSSSSSSDAAATSAAVPSTISAKGLTAAVSASIGSPPTVNGPAFTMPVSGSTAPVTRSGSSSATTKTTTTTTTTSTTTSIYFHQSITSGSSLGSLGSGLELDGVTGFVIGDDALSVGDDSIGAPGKESMDEYDCDQDWLPIEIGSVWKLRLHFDTAMFEYRVSVDVMEWSISHVHEWVCTVRRGLYKSWANKFRGLGIDGPLLLAITRYYLTSVIGIRSPRLRRLFYDELYALTCLKPCEIRRDEVDWFIEEIQKRRELKHAQAKLSQHEHVASTMSDPCHSSFHSFVRSGSAGSSDETLERLSIGGLSLGTSASNSSESAEESDSVKGDDESSLSLEESESGEKVMDPTMAILKRVVRQSAADRDRRDTLDQVALAEETKDTPVSRGFSYAAKAVTAAAKSAIASAAAKATSKSTSKSGAPATASKATATAQTTTKIGKKRKKIRSLRSPPSGGHRTRPTLHRAASDTRNDRGAASTSARKRKPKFETIDEEVDSARKSSDESVKSSVSAFPFGSPPLESSASKKGLKKLVKKKEEIDSEQPSLSSLKKFSSLGSKSMAISIERYSRPSSSAATRAPSTPTAMSTRRKKLMFGDAHSTSSFRKGSTGEDRFDDLMSDSHVSQISHKILNGLQRKSMKVDRMKRATLPISLLGFSKSSPMTSDDSSGFTEETTDESDLEDSADPPHSPRAVTFDFEDIAGPAASQRSRSAEVPTDESSVTLYDSDQLPRSASTSITSIRSRKSSSPLGVVHATATPKLGRNHSGSSPRVASKFAKRRSLMGSAAVPYSVLWRNGAVPGSESTPGGPTSSSASSVSSVSSAMIPDLPAAVESKKRGKSSPRAYESAGSLIPEKRGMRNRQASSPRRQLMKRSTLHQTQSKRKKQRDRPGVKMSVLSPKSRHTMPLSQLSTGLKSAASDESGDLGTPESKVSSAESGASSSSSSPAPPEFIMADTVPSPIPGSMFSRISSDPTSDKQSDDEVDLSLSAMVAPAQTSRSSPRSPRSGSRQSTSGSSPFRHQTQLSLTPSVSDEDSMVVPLTSEMDDFEF